jgi:DNA-binding NarL/FixJ family response regulator
MKKSAARSESIRVFIAEANYMACELAAKALSDSGERIKVAGAVTDSNGVVERLGVDSADVAVISSNLGDGRLAGFQVVRKLRASHPSIHIILLIDSNVPFAVVEAFRAGADGVLSRDESFEVLCKCIHAVHKGQIWASSGQLRLVLEALGKSEFERLRAADGANLLTNREEELVHWVAEGLTNTDISRQLNLSEHTVRNYLFRIFNKLGVSNRLELALYVIRQGKTLPTRVPQPSVPLEVNRRVTLEPYSASKSQGSVLVSDLPVRSARISAATSSASGTGTAH